MGKKSGKNKLTKQQSLFVAEYLKDLNATQACIRAGYSERSARFIGSEHLTKPNIQEAIGKALEAREKRTLIKGDEILMELIKVALCDIREAFDENGALKPIKEMPEAIAKAISSFEVEEIFEGRGMERVKVGETKKFRFWDKIKSLELLGKNLTMWIDRKEHTGKDGAPIQVKVTMSDSLNEKLNSIIGCKKDANKA